MDGTDPAALSDAMRRGRAETQQLLTLMRRHFPGFAQARLKAVAPVPGIRETRRIVGDFVLSVADLCAGREFDERADLFSLACVAYELLAGELAFPGRLGSQVLAVQPSVLDDLERRLAERAGEATARAVRAALEPDPGQRPATVEDFLARLA